MTRLGRRCMSLLIMVGLGARLCLGPLPLHALEPEPAAPASPVMRFDIPSTSLSGGLAQFAEQSGWQVFYSSELTDGLSTQGVSGTHSAGEALQILLRETGLGFSFVDAQTVTLKPAHTIPAPPAPAAPIQQNLADPPMRQGEKQPQAQKPVKVPEIVVKDVTERDDDATSYVAAAGSTATRTDTPLIQVPQSVGVVTQKVMQDQRALRMDQALRNVSGVVIPFLTLGNQADTVFCRGFPCAFFKNDMRNDNRNQTMTFRDIANVQRLEVLKGPPSVLYGRSDPGGIVNIITRQPQEEKYASIEQVIGSYNFYRTMADATGPLNADKTLLYRISGAYENSESFRDFVHGQRYFVAPVFTWKVSNRTTITFEGEYVRDNRTYDGGLPAIGRGIASIPISRFLSEPFNNQKVEEGRAGFLISHYFNSNWHLESRFRADRSSLLYRIVAPDAVQDDNHTLTRFLTTQDNDLQSYYWRNDLIGKLSTGPVRHRLLTGIEVGRQRVAADIGQSPYDSINIHNPLYFQNAAPAAAPFYQLRSFSNAVGAYVQDQVDLLDNLHLLIGARGDYFYLHSHANGEEQKSENYGFSPRIGVTYEPIRSVAVYANVTRSFNPVFGGLNPTPSNSNQFIPETATQYEAGIKTDIVPGRLTSTLAIYRILKKNALATNPANPFLQIQTGAQQSQGIEYDLAAQLLPGWQVIATYAYTDARLAADTDFPIGNRLPNIARHTGSFWTTYEFQEGGLRGLGVGAGIFAVGQRAGDLANTFYLPGYVRADAALYYRKPDLFARTNLIAQLNVQNLLDAQYFAGGGEGRGIAGLPGLPLAFFGSVKLEYY